MIRHPIGARVAYEGEEGTVVDEAPCGFTRWFTLVNFDHDNSQAWKMANVLDRVSAPWTPRIVGGTDHEGQRGDDPYRGAL